MSWQFFYFFISSESSFPKVVVKTQILFVFAVSQTQVKLSTATTATGLHGRNAVSHAGVALEGACVNAQVHLRPMVDEIAEAWVPV